MMSHSALEPTPPHHTPGTSTVELATVGADEDVEITGAEGNAVLARSTYAQHAECVFAPFLPQAEQLEYHTCG